MHLVCVLFALVASVPAWSQIDCHGGAPVPGRALSFSCSCPSSAAGLDCLSPPVCPSGTILRVGDSFGFNPVTLSLQGRILSGVPSSDAANISVVSVDFDIVAKNATLSVYSNAVSMNSSPILFTIRLWNCATSPSARQTFLCSNSSASLSGYPALSEPLIRVLASVTGLSGFSVSTFGKLFIFSNVYTGFGLSVVTATDFYWCGTNATLNPSATIREQSRSDLISHHTAVIEQLKEMESKVLQ